jgi:hypothetical protein
MPRGCQPLKTSPYLPVASQGRARWGAHGLRVAVGHPRPRSSRCLALAHHGRPFSAVAVARAENRHTPPPSTQHRGRPRSPSCPRSTTAPHTPHMVTADPTPEPTATALTASGAIGPAALASDASVRSVSNGPGGDEVLSVLQKSQAFWWVARRSSSWCVVRVRGREGRGEGSTCRLAIYSIYLMG